jgi:YHS domain-containing protein
VGGGSGTLGELAIAYDEGKLIGVLTGTGGISDLVSDILAACNKQTGARIIYSSIPDQLIQELLTVYRTEHFRRPSVFCSSHQSPTAIRREPAPGLERDVVCGMWIEPAGIVAVRTIEAVRYVFCSLECAERFDDTPEPFLERM